MNRVLFVTWDGPQVNYLESLFLPIFAALRPHGFAFDVLQFRWGEPAQTEAVRRRCAEFDVGYRSVGIVRRLGGAGAFASAVAGGRQVRRARRAFGSYIVMPRSLMPAIAVLRAGGRGLAPIVFDSDGLAADERVEFGGASADGAVYRLLRDAEARMVRAASAVIVRTGRGGEILRDRAGPGVSPDIFHTVTNGRDPAVFRPSDAAGRRDVRRAIGVTDDAPLIVYAGSVGAKYRLGDVGALAVAVRRLRPDTRLLVLSGSVDDARAAILAEHGQLADAAIFMRVPPLEVPRYLAAADLGVGSFSDGFSMEAVVPTKMSEYLLCGLPVAGTRRVGDTASAIRAGVFQPLDAGMPAVARWFVDEVLPRRQAFADRAREIGLAEFSLDGSVRGYLAALRGATEAAARVG